MENKKHISILLSVYWIADNITNSPYSKDLRNDSILPSPLTQNINLNLL